MTTESKGRDLFIVDNSVSGWTGLRYLEEWSGIAKAFDIATGYFEIGALLALDGRWQPLEKMRILMGAEMTHRTRKALLEAVRSRAVEILDGSIEAAKEGNPFLHGVPAILDALRSGQIECRVYDRDKFHAKAYITHAKLEVVGSQALVGSSNFTVPGLTKNIELNIQVQSAREVAQLQEWFEAHWNDASEVTDAVIDTISRHTHLYTPFDVYAKALQEFFRGHELTATEWDETRSKMFPRIDRYLYDLNRDAILEEPGEIVASIRSKPDTPRKCSTGEKTLVDLRARVEKHIKNTYLKRVDAPVGVKPALKCWMELNE